VRFESGSRLSRIEAWAFYGTGLIEIILPASIEILCVRSAFLFADHFPRLHLNPVRDCHELTSGHSVEVVWLKSFFLHQLKSWVRSAFHIADHLFRLQLNQVRDFLEMKGRFSVKLGGLTGMSESLNKQEILQFNLI
jgi:hypothetical protein